MKESNLAKAIDKAAEQRAEKIINRVSNAILEALKPHWRSTDTGDEHIGDDIRRLLRGLSEYNGTWTAMPFQPSPKMIDACRAAIVNDLLKGMPKLRELSQMAEMYEVCPQCGTSPCHCEAAEAN